MKFIECLSGAKSLLSLSSCFVVGYGPPAAIMLRKQKKTSENKLNINFIYSFQFDEIKQIKLLFSYSFTFLLAGLLLLCLGADA